MSCKSPAASGALGKKGLRGRGFGGHRGCKVGGGYPTGTGWGEVGRQHEAGA